MYLRFFFSAMCVLGLCGLAARALGEAATAPLVVGTEVQLLLNRSLVAEKQGARLLQHAPVGGGVVLRADQPWEGDVLYISSVFRQDGLYHMLYRGLDKLCLAVSRDGVNWEKPALGLVEFKGSRENNIVADDQGRKIGMCYTFYDPRPATPAGERVKALIWTDGEHYYHYPLDNEAGARPLSLAWRAGVRPVVLASADGRVFKPLPIEPNFKSLTQLPNGFDGGSIFWSEAEQRFVGYFRWWDDNPRPHARLLQDTGIITGRGVRSVFRSTSRDLQTWTGPEPMGYGESPREHIYENGTFPYFRAPHLYVGLANRFNPGRRALTRAEEETFKIRSTTDAKGRRFSYADDVNDLVLMVTRSGSLSYDRPFMEAFMRPGPNPRNWTSRCNYANLSGGLFPTGETEMSFWVTRQHYQQGNHIERMTLRLDGFASMNAPYEGGGFVTVPMVCGGDRLELNFATSGVSELRVEVQDSQGRALPGLSLEDCDTMIGDRIAGPVFWRGRESMAAYVGQPVRLRFQMADADIYSFRFTNAGKP